MLGKGFGKGANGEGRRGEIDRLHNQRSLRPGDVGPHALQSEKARYTSPPPRMTWPAWLDISARGELRESACLEKIVKDVKDRNLTDINLLNYLGSYSATCQCPGCHDRKVKHIRQQMTQSKKQGEARSSNTEMKVAPGQGKDAKMQECSIMQIKKAPKGKDPHNAKPPETRHQEGAPEEEEMLGKDMAIKKPKARTLARRKRRLEKEEEGKKKRVGGAVA